MILYSNTFAHYNKNLVKIHTNPDKIQTNPVKIQTNPDTVNGNLGLAKCKLKKIQQIHVRSHTGVIMNEKVDGMASKFVRDQIKLL